MAKEFVSPAFPIPGLHDDEDFNGLSKREYIAIKAMQSLILNPAPELLNGCGWDHIVAGAYQAADAMIAEGAK